MNTIPIKELTKFLQRHRNDNEPIYRHTTELTYNQYGYRIEKTKTKYTDSYLRGTKR